MRHLNTAEEFNKELHSVSEKLVNLVHIFHTAQKHENPFSIEIKVDDSKDPKFGIWQIHILKKPPTTIDLKDLSKD